MTLLVMIGAFFGAFIGTQWTAEDWRILWDLPGFLWDAARGRLPTEADVAAARAELEAMYRARTD